MWPRTCSSLGVVYAKELGETYMALDKRPLWVVSALSAAPAEVGQKPNLNGKQRAI